MKEKSSEDKQSKQAAATLHDNTISPRDDRKYRGKALREAISRESHAGWKVPAARPDPIELLEKSNEGRLADLIPIRYGRMLPSPFTFFRGAAALMAFDVASTPTTHVKVQACGDCHLLNFGAFATPERNIVFDINDFDETLPAPWEWDIKRLATSFVLVARDNGMAPGAGPAAVESLVRSYREQMALFGKMSILDIWYTRIDWQNVVEKTSDEELQKKRKDQIAKARKKSIQHHYFPKLTESVGGHYRIKDNPPLIYHMESEVGNALDDRLKSALHSYKDTLQEDRQRLLDRYKLEDIAIKVVGVGSVGTVCAVALFLAPDDDPLFLQVKEARPSVLEPYAGASEFVNHGQRVVAGQRIIQAASDIFLGWTKFDNGKHFYIRQLRDMKVSLDPTVWDETHIVDTAQVMGAVLARAHARSGDAAVISGYLGKGNQFDLAIADFAMGYADQTEKDHAALAAAVKSGRIKVQEVE